MQSLEGKRAIVTGGGHGIGRASALLLAERGAAVVIADRHQENGSGVAQEIARAGGRSVFVPCDVSSAEDCRRTVEQTRETFGGLEILVNSAGIIRRSTVCEITDDDWDLVMGVNVRSIMLMGRYAIPVMRSSGGGSIVNIGSGWGMSGGGQAVSYCASKGAVVNMTRAMAIDHGPDGIRVNCVCPGDTDTGMLEDEARQLGEDEAAFLADAADRPLQRIGQPVDIARMVEFLAGNAAAFVTGAIIPVDGGGTA